MLYSFWLTLLSNNFLFLVPGEKKLRRVLAAVVVRHAVRGPQLPVLTLQALDDGHEHQRAAKLVTKVLVHRKRPMGRLRNKHKSAFLPGCNGCRGCSQGG